MNIPHKILGVETKEHVTVVTIRRPEILNSISMELLEALRDLFRELQKDRDTRGIILTGTGGRAFAAGADINELSRLKTKSGEKFSLRGQAVFATIESTGKPVIAAVEGYALGAGCELAMCCHLRVASRTARFGLPETGLGIIPGFGGTQRLTRMIGKGRALEMIIDGSPVDAVRALEIGLVNKVVDEGRTVESSVKWMRNIITKAPEALDKAIQAVHAAYPNRAHGFRQEAEMFGYLCGTSDFKEGARAFLEKRKPDFGEDA